MIIDQCISKNSSMQTQTKRKVTQGTVEKIREKFPMLDQKIERKRFIYFDNAATGHKPQTVLESLQKFYTEEYGKPKTEYKLGKQASGAVEEVRSKIAAFIGAS